MTPDQAAIAILLSKGSDADKQNALKRLARHAAIMRGDICPECGGTDCDDNSAKGFDLTFLCYSCGHQWTPADEEVAL